MPIVLPFQVNALYIESPEQVIGQDIRFENVPWMNTEKDVFENPNVPLETNSIIPRPFSYDNAIYLDKGVHLHFVLPSYFKKFDDKGNLPKAPNRWYLKRERGEKEWIVESDYIWDVNDPKLNKYTTCSYVEGEVERDFQFKYVGRKYEYQEWKNKGFIKNNNLNNLTALGWGSFSFDVHYPNCRSVFGFYDAEGIVGDEYSIVGWIENDSNELIVSGFFELIQEENPENKSEESFDISIANTLSETVSALIVNKSNHSISAQDAQKKEEQIASILNFDELNDLDLDWVSRLRHKSHEQQFNKIPGTTQFILNILDKNNDEVIEEYDFDVNLIDFDWNKPFSDKYQNIQQSLNNIDDSHLDETNIREIIKNITLSEVKNTSHDSKLDEKQQELTKALNSYELASFRLHTEIESLYIHWSTYLNALFVNKEKDINKLKEDLHLLVSQINILKDKLQYQQKYVNQSELAFLEKVGEAYSKYCDYKIFNFLLKEQPIDENYQIEWKRLIHLKYNTKVVLAKKAKTNYFTALPPSVIISSPGENNIFNLFTNPVTFEGLKENDPFDYGKLRKGDYNIYSACQKVPVNTWHTYKVEWESYFLPKKNGHYLNNEGIHNKDDKPSFKEDYLQDVYTLDELNADLIKDYNLSDIAYLSSPNSYFGHSFVSNTVKAYVQDKLGNSSFPKEDNKELNNQITDFLETLKSTHLFELTLSDFNNLMLQRSNGLSILPLIPNGFKDHKDLAKSIETLCKDYGNNLNLLTPNHLSTFNPFRNGAFKINRLRIIDSFGREKMISPEKIITTHTQCIENKNNWVALPPRYLHPATISARFVNTKTNHQNSPVVGWMIPVYINQHIEFFDAEGKHLGAIDTDGNWESSPFDVYLAQHNSDYTSVIKNPDLRRIVHWIIENFGKTSEIKDFIHELQLAMEHTSPEDYANPSLLETISSIPIAITIVDINLYTKGEALFDINDSQRISINTYNNQRKYDKVKIPVSLGDLNQYNDGLLAYWHYNIEKPDEETSGKSKIYNLNSDIYFNSDVSKKIGNEVYSLKNYLVENPTDGLEKWEEIKANVEKDNSNIKYKHQDTGNFLSLNDTLRSCQRYALMHPKGKLHIKSGIVPEIHVQLPYNKIKNALKRIELTLLTSPILTPKEDLQISLVKDKRYEWSWIALEKQNKKLPLSITNPPLKKRFTHKLSIDFNEHFEAKMMSSFLSGLISDLKNKNLLLNDLIEIFGDDDIFFINKKDFLYHYDENFEVKNIINELSTIAVFKNEDIQSKKVAFDFNEFKTKAEVELQGYIENENYTIKAKPIPESNENLFFLNQENIRLLQEESLKENDNPKKLALINLLSYKNSKKIKRIGDLSNNILAFSKKSFFRNQLIAKNIISSNVFFFDEEIHFIDPNELEKLKMKEVSETLDESEILLLKMVDEKSIAISRQISDFNINSPNSTPIVLKEGWLALKSTKF